MNVECGIIPEFWFQYRWSIYVLVTVHILVLLPIVSMRQFDRQIPLKYLLYILKCIQKHACKHYHYWYLKQKKNNYILSEINMVGITVGFFLCPSQSFQITLTGAVINKRRIDYMAHLSNNVVWRIGEESQRSFLAYLYRWLYETILHTFQRSSKFIFLRMHK